ncbi:siphovirus ReqiPepy6 Gp37-like family protein [Streptomyces sp. BV286]|uniref:siphovirus ReqiPepy6 Gp37-like family protein n=1 Tax=Streptomyces sp. BV286 TaxID=2849672 RepID=UPI001C2E2A79|nr:siphovirus ReqiPepy6 Gp37-like family protein [Streptomyces sp. BV286]MBV1940775.1 siphovirus ReqiPepy6 Gp37-like family protein [Streptomyces sp. BV286]
MAAGWRFIAQRALTETVLDWDVPLSLSSNPKRELCGPGSMNGTIEPEFARMIGEDGNPLFQEWGTKLYAEIDGEIRWGGVVTKTSYDDAKYTINCEGFSCYPHGIPYEGHFISGKKLTPKDPYAGKDKNHDGYIDGSKPKKKVPKPPKPYAGTRYDVFHAFRHIWFHIQSKPFGDIGMEIDQHNLGELLGTSDGEDPYELAWWNNPDCGQAIDQLTTSTPFDWTETHAWADNTSTTIKHRIKLGKPRLGRKRTDLRFMDGENLTAIAKPEGLGDEYANEVYVLGKGEGQKMKKAHLYNLTTGRLRRVVTVVDKTLSSDSALRSRGNLELTGHSQALQIPAIQIRNHPNARFGSWSIGDDILVQVEVPWVGDVAIWHRIISDELSPNDMCVLTLKRSDSFVY